MTRRERLARGVFFLALLVLWGSPRPVQGQSYMGTVHAVLDGDTIRLLTETGQIVQIELYGVDAPERGQPYGNAATQAVRRAVFRTRVQAVAEGSDPDGRSTFVVRTDDYVLNERLLRDGLVWWDRKQASHDDRYQRLERKARAKGRGLWARPDPVPPWRWRGEDGP